MSNFVRTNITTMTRPFWRALWLCAFVAGAVACVVGVASGGPGFSPLLIWTTNVLGWTYVLALLLVWFPRAKRETS